MEGNLAPVLYDEPRTELIDGKVVAISPRPVIDHNQISGNIYHLFVSHLWGKPCRPFADGNDLYLTDRDHFIPDVMVVCDKSKVKRTHVEGAPDLVVEVLSLSTARRDKGHKKTVYERCGVREYWIVDPAGRSIEQYVLEDGAFTLRGVYYHYRAYELDDMTDEEKAEVVTEFHPAIFEDMTVRLEDVFYYV